MDKSVLEKIPIPVVENKYNMTSTSAQFPAPKHSGRVPNMSDPKVNEFASRPYSLYSHSEPVLTSDPRRDLIGHVHSETPLNRVFFSQSNIDNLQTKIADQVYAMTGNKHRIDRQNDDDVKLVMRSYYLTYADNNPALVAESLEDLNGRVVGYCAAKIFSELDFYLFYRKDIEDFAPPIANPTNTQVYGTRYGELKRFF